jgi:hypothetical protein
VRFVCIVEGALEVRWTWLPYWLAINPPLIRSIEDEVFDLAKLNATTNSEADLELLHTRVCELLGAAFPAFPGLAQFLRGLSQVQEPD